MGEPEIGPGSRDVKTRIARKGGPERETWPRRIFEAGRSGLIAGFRFLGFRFPFASRCLCSAERVRPTNAQFQTADAIPGGIGSVGGVHGVCGVGSIALVESQGGL